MGGAQPLAIKLAGGVSLCVEVDPKRIQRRLETRYLDTATNSLDEAIRLAQSAKTQRKAVSIGLTGNAAELLPEMVKQGFIPGPRYRSDQFPRSHVGYIPIAHADEDLNALRSLQPQVYTERVHASIAQHVQAILEMQRRGAIALRLWQQPAHPGEARRRHRCFFPTPAFVPAFIRDSFL